MTLDIKSKIHEKWKKRCVFVYTIYVCLCMHSGFEGRLSAKGADLALAAAPLAAGVGQTHYHVPALSISLAQGFQDLLRDERTGRPAENFLLVVSWCEAHVSVPLEDTLHHRIVTQALWGLLLMRAEQVLWNICCSKICKWSMWYKAELQRNFDCHALLDNQRKKRERKRIADYGMIDGVNV